MKLSNNQADIYLSALKDIAPKVTGKFGYAVARNIRELTASLTEYHKTRNDLITKYGEISGEEVVLKSTSEFYVKFIDELKTYAEIEHDVNIMAVEPEEIFNSTLTADVINGIMFMIKECDENG